MTLKNPKGKGSRAEREAKIDLESRNFFVVKAGGSLGAFDLIAMPTVWALNEQPLCLAIQVKSNRMPSKGELRNMAFVPLPPYFRKELWIKNDRQGWVKYDILELTQDDEDFLKSEEAEAVVK